MGSLTFKEKRRSVPATTFTHAANLRFVENHESEPLAKIIGTSRDGVVLPEDGSRFRTTNMEFFEKNQQLIDIETRKQATQQGFFKKKSPFYSFVDAAFNSGVYR